MSNPVPLVRVITRLNIGGPSRQALLLARALAPEYETVLAAGVPARDEGELTDDRVVVTPVPLVRPVSPIADARALRAMSHLLATVRPQVMHTHMAKAGTVGRLASMRLRLRSESKTLILPREHFGDRTRLSQWRPMAKL